MKVLIVSSSNDLNHALVQYALQSGTVVNHYVICSNKAIKEKWEMTHPTQVVLSSSEEVADGLNSMSPGASIVLDAVSVKLLQCPDVVNVIRGQSSSNRSLIVSTDQPLKFGMTMQKPWASYDQVWIPKCTNASKLNELQHFVTESFAAPLKAFLENLPTTIASGKKPKTFAGVLRALPRRTNASCLTLECVKHATRNQRHHQFLPSHLGFVPSAFRNWVLRRVQLPNRLHQKTKRKSKPIELLGLMPNKKYPILMCSTI